MTDLREPSDPHPRSSGLRQAALGAVGFVATLVLLFGLLSLVGRGSGGDTVGGALSAAPSSGAAGSRAPGSAAPVAVAPATPEAAASAGSTGSASAPSATAPAAPQTTAPAAATAVPPTSPGPAPSGDPVLVGAGDIAVCGLDGDQATADLIDGIQGTVFTAGDNAYESGSAAEFRNCYDPTWGRFLARTRPAPGNHDHNTKDLAGYLGYFGTAAAPNGTSWYSYDLGRWHVVVLDSSCGDVGGCGPGSAQGTWLAADLGASEAICTIAIWHHPRFSSGFHGNAPDVAPFWEALYKVGADVVVNGHDHDYERFAPQDPAGVGDVARGMREFVVGTGGAELRDFAEIKANSVVRASGSHGVIRFVLRPTGYDWTFTSTTGEFKDIGSGTCH